MKKLVAIVLFMVLMGVTSAYTENFDLLLENNSGEVKIETTLVGTSTTSWEEAAKNALESSVIPEDVRIANIKDLDMKIEDGKVVLFRVVVKLSSYVTK